MGIKSMLSSHLSPQQMTKIKKPVMYARYAKSIMKHTYGLREVNKDFVDDIKTYSMQGKHVFFGYYDLQQFDKAKKRLLVHVLDAQKCDPSKDSIDLMYIDRATGDFFPITSTRAWSWQQGSRLRWHPMKENCVLFNAVEGKRYATVVWNIETEKKETVYPMAFYDITPDMKYGLNVNYDRLQRLRPGYGYSCFKDTTAGMSAPENEGIVRYNIETGESRLLISLKEIAERVTATGDVEHYINHISVSPSGKKFLFFHLWSSTHTAKWDMNLYVADIETGELSCVEDDYVISHYCWKDDNELVTTTGSKNGEPPKYIKYNLIEKTSVIQQGEWLNRDGHPSYIHGGGDYISDTYPISCMQYVFKEKENVGSEILRVYSDPRLFEEKRCDLHPRLTPDNTFITVDSKYKNCLRSVVEMEMKKGWDK